MAEKVLGSKVKKSKAKKIAPAKTRTTFKKKQLVLKKQINARKKRVSFQDKVLKKLVELLDGITIDPVKGVILTPRKKRQLAEFQEMGQKLLKSKSKNFGS